MHGDYCEVLGRWDEAIAEGARSKEVSPVSADMRLNLGLALTYGGRFDDAVRECRSALELDSLSSWSYFCLTDAYLRKGAQPEALTAAQHAVQLAPDDLNQSVLGLVYVRLGCRGDAEAIAEARLSAAAPVAAFRVLPREG